MNVALGNESAIEGYRKPFEREMYTDDALIEKAESLGIPTKLEPAKEDSEDCPPDLLAARIQGFVHYRPAPGKRLMVVGIPPETPIDVAFSDITRPGKIWSKHAAANSKPTWVESDDPILAQMLAKHYDCPVGRPDGWVETYV